MNIIPAIDLQNRQCVRLYQGKFEQSTIYSAEPLQVAQNFARAGAHYLHVVDLDGAKTGQLTQYDLIYQLAQESNLAVQVGGGIRTTEQIQNLLAHDIQRVVIGSMAVTKPTVVGDWLKQFGGSQLILAFDIIWQPSVEPQVVIQGWQQKSTASLFELLTHYQQIGLQQLLCTDINRDGTLQGPNIALYQLIRHRFPQLQIQASGGIGKLTDLQQLQQIPTQAAIIGRALYEKNFTVEEALQCSRNASSPA